MQPDSVSYYFLPVLFILVWASFLPTLFILRAVSLPARRLHHLHETVHLMQSRLDLFVDEGRISSKTAQGLSSDLAKATTSIHSLMWDLENVRFRERICRYILRGPEFHQLKQLSALVDELRADIRALDRDSPDDAQGRSGMDIT
ncbi:hypothetical protein ACG7TL_008569 [Trametes sanguinea]